MSLLSGSTLYDTKTQENFQESQAVNQLFSNDPIFQKSMGYNYQLINPVTRGPSLPSNEGPIFDGAQTPVDLQRMFPGVQIHQVKSIHLNCKEKISQGSFVMVKHFS